MNKHKIISAVIISVCTILIVLFVLKEEGVFKKNDIEHSAKYLLATLSIEDEDFGYEQFLNSLAEPKKEKFTKEKYIEFKNNNESSAVFENYFLVKYTSKNYLLIRYQKKGNKIEIVDVKIVPNEFKELFSK